MNEYTCGLNNRERGVFFSESRLQPFPPQAGYTLIELIVVMVLLSLMLGISLPRVQDVVTLDKSRKAARMLLTTIHHLKQAAGSGQSPMVLHLDLDKNCFWTAVQGLDGEAADEAAAGAVKLPDSTRFEDILFIDGNAVNSGVAAVSFYPQGYSDWAVIHMTDDNEQHVSFLIEPFLSRARMLNHYYEFEG